MTKKNEFILVGLGFACLILFVALITVLQEKEPAEEAVDGWDKLCYLKTIQPGQGITENGPGEYEYTLIMTTQGTDVYIPCENER